MSDPLAENRARLEQLLEEMKSLQHFRKADEIAEEIWKVLTEREQLKREIAARNKSA